MLTFTNVSTPRLEKIPSPLPPNCTLVRTEVKDGKEIYVLKSVEQITVPTTAAELIEILQTVTDTVQIDLGGKKLTVPVPVASYIRDQKLQSQQAMQAALRTDNKGSARSNTFAWFMASDPKNVAEGIRRLQQAGQSSTAGKAHNAWLDEMYLANKDAVDAYAKKS